MHITVHVNMDCNGEWFLLALLFKALKIAESNKRNKWWIFLPTEDEQHQRYQPFLRYTYRTFSYSLTYFWTVNCTVNLRWSFWDPAVSSTHWKSSWATWPLQLLLFLVRQYWYWWQKKKGHTLYKQILL